MREWTEKHIRELIQNELKKLKGGGNQLSYVNFGDYPSVYHNTGNTGEITSDTNLYNGCMSSFSVLDTFIPGRNAEIGESRAKEKITICFHLKNRKQVDYLSRNGYEINSGIIGFYPSTGGIQTPKLAKADGTAYKGPNPCKDGIYGVSDFNERVFAYQNGNYFPLYAEQQVLWDGNTGGQVNCSGYYASLSRADDVTFENEYPENYTHWKYYDFSDGVKIYMNYFIF